MRDTRRFGRLGTFLCRICVKKTRDTGHDEASVGLCRVCLEGSEAENYHNDHHDSNLSIENCPSCLQSGNLELWLRMAKKASCNY